MDGRRGSIAGAGPSSAWWSPAWWGLGLALVLLAPGALDAQDPVVGREAEPLRVDLEQALAFAEGSNPALRRATNYTTLNAVETRTTWFDQLLPTASLTLFNTAFTGNLQRQALDPLGNPIVDPGADWNYFSQTTHSLNLGWGFQGASLFQRHDRLALTNLERDLARLSSLTTLQVQVQRLYVDAQEQLELMRAEEELIEARRIDLDVAGRLFSLALRTRVDVLNAELAIEQQALAYEQQRAAYERALLALRSAMGLTDEGPIEIVEEDLPLFDPGRFDPDALISRAIEENPSVLQADAATRSAQLSLDERRTAWWPRIDANVNLFRRAFEPEANALFDSSLDQSLEGQFSIRFSLPILNQYFQEDLERARARVELSNERENDRQARLELEEAIRGALLDLEGQWATVRLAERSATIAEEALRLAREEYRIGTRSFEDLRSSFEAEAQTRRQVIQARHGFVDALLTLEEAVGTPLREGMPTPGGA